jgi:hypothetical protein
MTKFVASEVDCTTERWVVTYMIKNGITKEKILIGKNANVVAKYFEFKYRHKPLSVVAMNTEVR